jgi:hypothetical protein
MELAFVSSVATLSLKTGLQTIVAKHVFPELGTVFDDSL